MNDFLYNMTLYQTIGLLFVVALVAHTVLSLFLKKLLSHTSKTKNQWDDCLIHAIAMPLKFLVWFGWIYLCLDAAKTQISALDKLAGYINIIPVFIVVWGVLRILSGVESQLLSNSKNIDRDSIRLVTRLLKILITIAIALGMAQYLGFSIASLLTFGGVGGIVIGFAAKDMLSNIFGGLMIQMDKPFSTGDWIRSTQFEGVVEKIGWRMTRIRTFSKNPVYIPNSIFSSIPIETPSRMTNRRIKEVIGIRYDDIAQLPNIINAVETLLSKHPSIDHTQTLCVYFDHFNASSLDFTVYAFTKSVSKIKYQTVKAQILLSIAEIIAEHKAEIAYPTQTLHIQK